MRREREVARCAASSWRFLMIDQVPVASDTTYAHECHTLVSSERVGGERFAGDVLSCKNLILEAWNHFTFDLFHV